MAGGLDGVCPGVRVPNAIGAGRRGRRSLEIELERHSPWQRRLLCVLHGRSAIRRSLRRGRLPTAGVADRKEAEARLQNGAHLAGGEARESEPRTRIRWP